MIQAMLVKVVARYLAADIVEYLDEIGDGADFAHLDIKNDITTIGSKKNKKIFQVTQLKSLAFSQEQFMEVMDAKPGLKKVLSLFLGGKGKNMDDLMFDESFLKELATDLNVTVVDEKVYVIILSPVFRKLEVEYKKSHLCKKKHKKLLTMKSKN